MKSIVQRIREHRLLAGILLLGAVLRCIGLSWGIPTPAVPHLLSHFDEDMVMNALAQVDVRRGDWNPDWGHNEGPLNYFIWVGAAATMRVLGIVEHMPNAIPDPAHPDYFRVVMAGRLIVVFFDVCAILLIYLSVMKMTASKAAALFGALLFALFPFEIVHSHYMRPHVLGNLLVCLTIHASLFIYGAAAGPLVFIATGLVLALATVTRYNLLPVAIVPYAVFLYRRLVLDGRRLTPKYVLASLFHWRMALVGVAFVVGVLVADWPILFDFESVRVPFVYQLGTSAFGPPTLANIANLAMPLRYVVSVIPDASFLLWIVFYPAVVYVLCRPGLYRYVLPLCAFLFPYLYYVTKAYGLIAARPVMPLFPVLAILSALAFDDLRRRAWYTAPVRQAVAAVLGFVLLGTFLFDLACVRAMADREADPFVQVHAHFSGADIPDTLDIGFHGIYWERYQTRNFSRILNAIPGKRVTVDADRLDYLEHPRDYVLVFQFDDTMDASTEAALARLTASRDYAVARVFRKRLALGPVAFDYDAMPTDFRYAFPVIHLLKSTGRAHPPRPTP